MSVKLTKEIPAALIKGSTGATQRGDLLTIEDFQDDSSKARDLFTHDDFVETSLGLEPVSYLLAGTSRNLETPMPETVRAQHMGKAFMSGLTLGNYEYTPDDIWSMEGLAWFGGQIAPFYTMYLAGAAAGGRMLASIRWGRQTGAHGLRPGGQAGTAAGPLRGSELRKFRAENSFSSRARSVEDTWGALVPQASVEAGLWTMADPTLDGPQGYAEALAYTTVGQAAVVGLSSYFRNTWPSQKNWVKDKIYKNQSTDISEAADNVTHLDKVEGANPKNHGKNGDAFNKEVKNLKGLTKDYTDAKQKLNTDADAFAGNAIENNQSIITDKDGTLKLIDRDGGELVARTEDIHNLHKKEQYDIGMVNKLDIEDRIKNLTDVGDTSELVLLKKEYNYLANQMRDLGSKPEMGWSIPEENIAATVDWIKELKDTIKNPKKLEAAIKEAKARIKKDISNSDLTDTKWYTPEDIIERRLPVSAIIASRTNANPPSGFYKEGTNEELLPIWKAIDNAKTRAFKELIQDGVEEQAVIGMSQLRGVPDIKGASGADNIGYKNLDELKQILEDKKTPVNMIMQILDEDNLQVGGTTLKLTSGVNKENVLRYLDPYTQNPGHNNYSPVILDVGDLTRGTDINVLRNKPYLLVHGSRKDTRVMSRKLVLNTGKLLDQGILEIDKKTLQLKVANQKEWEKILTPEVISETTVHDAFNLQKLGEKVDNTEWIEKKTGEWTPLYRRHDKEIHELLSSHDRTSSPSWGVHGEGAVFVNNSYVLNSKGYINHHGIIDFVIDRYGNAYPDKSIVTLSDLLKRVGGKQTADNGMVIYNRIIYNKDVNDYQLMGIIKNKPAVKQDLQEVGTLILTETINKRLVENMVSHQMGTDAIDAVKMFDKDKQKIIDKWFRDRENVVDNMIAAEYKLSKDTQGSTLNIHSQGYRVRKEKYPYESDKLKDAETMSNFAEYDVVYRGKRHQSIEEAYHVWKSGKENKQLVEDIRNIAVETPVIKHEYKGGQLNELIDKGIRTQTTRGINHPKYKVGDELISESTGLQVPIKITKVTEGYNPKDFAKQGYKSADEYIKHIEKSEGPYTTYDFKKIKTASKLPMTPAQIKMRANALYDNNRWYAKVPEQHPDTLFIYGDNNAYRQSGKVTPGTVGTSVVRAADNALGIRTRIGEESGYANLLSIGNSKEGMAWIKEDIAAIKKAAKDYDRVVLPPVGQATSKLQDVNPDLYKFLQAELSALKKHLGNKLIIKGEMSVDTLNNRKFMEKLLMSRFMRHPDIYSDIVQKYDKFSHLGKGIDNFWSSELPEIIHSAIVKVAGKKKYSKYYLKSSNKDIATQVIKVPLSNPKSGLETDITKAHNKFKTTLKERTTRFIERGYSWNWIQRQIKEAPEDTGWRTEWNNKRVIFNMRNNKLFITDIDTAKTVSFTKPSFIKRMKNAVVDRIEEKFTPEYLQQQLVDIELAAQKTGEITPDRQVLMDSDDIIEDFYIRDVQDSGGKELDIIEDLKTGKQDSKVIEGMLPKYGNITQVDSAAARAARDSAMVRQRMKELDIIKQSNINLRLFSNALAAHGIWGPTIDRIYNKYITKEGIDWLPEMLKVLDDNRSDMAKKGTNIATILDDYKYNTIKAVEEIEKVLKRTRSESDILGKGPTEFEDVISILIKDAKVSAPDAVPSRAHAELDKVQKDLEMVYGQMNEFVGPPTKAKAIKEDRWSRSSNQAWGVVTNSAKQEGTTKTIPLDYRKNMIRHESDNYPPRTAANIARSDATIIYGGMAEKGSKLTQRLAIDKSDASAMHTNRLHKDEMFWRENIPEERLNKYIQDDAQYIVDNDIRVINGAGNRAEVLKDLNVSIDKIEDYITRLLNRLWEHHGHSVHIISGGQTGVDQAFLKVAAKLGQPNVSPKIQFGILRKNTDLVYLNAGTEDALRSTLGTNIQTGSGSYKAFDPDKSMKGKAEIIGEGTVDARYIDENYKMSEKSSLNKSIVENIYYGGEARATDGARLGSDYFLNLINQHKTPDKNVIRTQGKSLYDSPEGVSFDASILSHVYTETTTGANKFIPRTKIPLTEVIQWHHTGTIEKIIGTINADKQKKLQELGVVRGISGMTKSGDPMEAVIVYVPPNFRRGNGLEDIVMPITIMMREKGRSIAPYHFTRLAKRLETNIRKNTEDVTKQMVDADESFTFKPDQKQLFQGGQEDYRRGIKGLSIRGAASDTINPHNHPKIYQFVEDVLSNVYHKSDKISFTNTNLSLDVLNKSFPLTQEFVTRVHQILSDFIAEHGHKNLDMDWLKGILSKVETQHSIKPDQLPRAKDGLNFQAKRELEKLKVYLYAAGEASRYNVPVDAIQIKQAKDRWKKLGLKMGKQNPAQNKTLYSIAKDIEKSLKNILHLHNQTGLLEKGTAKSLEDITAVTGGLEKLLKDSRFRDAEFSKLQKSLARDIEQEITAGVKGKLPTRKPNKFTADSEQTLADIKKIMSRTSEVNMGRINADDFALTDKNLASVEMKIWLDDIWNTIMNSEIAHVITDFPEIGEAYMFKTLAQQVGKDQATDIHNNFKSYILNSEDAAMSVFEAVGWRGNKVEKLYHLVRQSKGLDKQGLSKYKQLQDASNQLSDLKMATHLRRLENEPLDGNFYLKDDLGELGNPLVAGNDGVTRGVDGSLTQMQFGRYLARLIYSDPHTELDILGKAMNDSTFPSAAREMLDAEQWITNFSNMGDVEKLGQVNIKKIIYKRGNWAHEQDRLVKEVYNGDVPKFQKDVEEPAYKLQAELNKEMTDIAAKETAALKNQLRNAEWWAKSGHKDWENQVNYVRSVLDEENHFLFHKRLHEWTTEYVEDPNILSKLKEEGKDFNVKNPHYNKAVHQLKLQYDKAIEIKQAKAAEVFELKLTGKEGTTGSRTAYDITLSPTQATNILSLLKSVDSTYNDILDATIVAGRKKANDWAARKGHLHAPLATDIKRIPYYKPLFGDGPLQVGVKIRNLNPETGKGQTPWRDRYFNLGNFSNHKEATAYIKEWYAKNGKGLDKENTTLIIQPAESAYKNVDISDLSRVDATHDIRLGDLEQIIQRTDPNTGLRIQVDDVMPYVASQTRKRALTQQEIPTKFFEQDIFGYALRGAKDGAFAKSYMMFQHLQEKLIRAGRPNDAEYLSKLMFAALGKRSSLERFVNDTANSILEYITRIPGATVALDTLNMLPGSNNFRRLSSMMTSVSSFAALGFNVSTALLQLSIIGLNVVPQFGMKNWTRAFQDIKHVGIKNTDYYNDINEVFNTMNLHVLRNDGSIQDVVLRASRAGTLPSDHTTRKLIDAALENPKEGIKKLPKYMRDNISRVHDMSMYMFNQFDRYPRMMTAIMAYNNADDVLKGIAKKIQNYKKDFYVNPNDYLNLKERLMWNRVHMAGLDKDVANYGKFMKQSDDVRRLKKDFAVEFTRKTNHTYNTTNVPLAFTETTARPFLQFKTWVQKQSMFYLQTFAERPKKLGVAAYEDFLKTTGAFMALGGAFSLPGMQETDALMRHFWGVSPKAMMYEMDSPFADIFTAGLFAGMGVSVEGRMGPGALHTTVDTGNIFGIYGNRLKKAFQAMQKGNPEAALNYTLPKALQNLRQGYELATTGKLQSTYSNQLLLDYNKMEANSTYAALWKMMGFEDMAENKYRTIKYALIDGSRVTGRNIKFAYEEIFEHIEAGRLNRARDIASEYNIEWNKVRKRYKEVHEPEYESLDIPYSDSNPELEKRDKQFKELLESM